MVTHQGSAQSRAKNENLSFFLDSVLRLGERRKNREQFDGRA